MIDNKTLFVSDLDGTLLNSSQCLSEYTISTINRLVEDGMIFSYATARSYVTASRVTQGISPKLPVIVYNGCSVLQNGSGKQLLSVVFTEQETDVIRAGLAEHGISPIVYAYIDGIEKFSYCNRDMTADAQEFLLSRKGDIRDHPVPAEQLYFGEVFYITCIDASDKLFPVYEMLKDSFYCVYQKDIYSGAQWLEIMPGEASKANAVMKLKKLLGCERVVSFGDGKNDIPMFQISDECYAVENADAELKCFATAVIGSNDADGVARWLAKMNKKEKSSCVR